MNSSDVQDAADWMLVELSAKGELHQSDVVIELEKRCPDLIYENELGNQAIDRRVLREFRRLTEGTVVWVRDEFYWRIKQEGDLGRVGE